MVGSNTMNERYKRQTCLPSVGKSGQAVLQASEILVVGVGGLGAPVLQYLVAAGVGKVTLVDGDTVNLSNLQRQTLFRESDVGKLKVIVAEKTLRALNTNCVIETSVVPLDPENAKNLVESSNLVLDCADSFATSYILSDTCKTLNVPLISASALEFEGYVGGFCHTAPSLRAVFPDLPERAGTCETLGVMGPVVGLIGAAQAQMALAYLIRQRPSPLGQFICFDLKNFRCREFRFDNAPDPNPDLTFITEAEITKSDFVIDLREKKEVKTLVAKNARRVNLADFTEQQLLPDAGQRAVFACRSGLRAWQAATKLRSYWNGKINLIAMGNAPNTERKKI